MAFLDTLHVEADRRDRATSIDQREVQSQQAAASSERRRERQRHDHTTTNNILNSELATLGYGQHALATVNRWPP